RRHTRFSRDWSSDVCSSDLTLPYFHRHALKTDGRHVVLSAGIHTAGYFDGKIFIKEVLRIFIENDFLQHYGRTGTAGNTQVTGKIGRASCRERRKIEADAVA